MGANVLISDILRNNVKEKLARDEVVASMTVRLIRTIEIARIARTAGFDSLYVDLEHSSFSLETCGQICMAAVEAGIAPFGRVPADTPDYSPAWSKAARSGSSRRMSTSADEAQTVVRAAKFSPLGERSNAGGLPHLHFRASPPRRPMPDSTPPPWSDSCSLERGRARQDRGSWRSRRRSGAGRARRSAGGLGHSRTIRSSAVREAYASTISAACRRHGKHCGVGGLSTRPDPGRRVRADGPHCSRPAPTPRSSSVPVPHGQSR